MDKYVPNTAVRKWVREQAVKIHVGPSGSIADLPLGIAREVDAVSCTEAILRYVEMLEARIAQLEDGREINPDFDPKDVR